LWHELARDFHYASVVSDQQTTNSVRTKRRVEVSARLRSSATLALLWIFRTTVGRRHIDPIDVDRGPQTIKWSGRQ
jgi:hypothetical protein